MEWVVLIFYLGVLSFIFCYSLGQLHLVMHYRKREKQNINQQVFETDSWPKVTVQLPIYNELYVVDRLIDKIVALDYPSAKLEIQVLDDSTDQTVERIAEKVNYYQKQGVDIQHIRRPERKGFKAGALDYGMKICKGEFLAIFDADFLPDRDFLKKMVPNFEEGVGVVQARWGHINRDYSLFTRLQAFGLDAHFTVEQGGRNAAHSFINFNGTAGVWRKTCIEDAGGWRPDTLTEDLDLSYRAQIKGWKFRFMEEIEAPAELPVTMEAIKSQQFRWNKGAAECARKHLLNVLRQRLPLSTKLHAVFHLLNSSVFIFLLLASLCSVPMLWVKAHDEEISKLFHIGNIFLIGFFSIAYFYWVSVKQMQQYNSEIDSNYYWKNFPVFLMISMGLSLHNSIAVLEGWFGFKSPFIRTPKFNVTVAGDNYTSNIYVKHRISPQTVIEGMLCLYFLFGIGLGVQLNDFGLVLFHSMLAFGFGSICWQSLKN
ncbi:cellulose synthase family protein [Limibacter armeniacum]|uniref:cellulose synthase family protein n=1 Tax=Limibacter armeniacum TaxID=466084 RepID=UPI002FE5FE9E